MVKKIFLLHVLPFLLTILLFLALFLLPDKKSGKTIEIIKGSQKTSSGHFSSLKTDQDEIDFLASIKHQEILTIFGSSEFSGSSMCPYIFFPENFGIPALGMGHAYHQNLSILIELLAANEYLDSNSKVCIILSPGWFATAGTNTEAFVEFAKPNFLRKIAMDTTIDDKYKLAIGEYVAVNNDDFTSLNPEMVFFKDAYLKANMSYMNQHMNELKTRIRRKFIVDLDQRIQYQFMMNTTVKPKKWNADFEDLEKDQKKAVLAKMTNNKFYVNDYYFKTYLEPDGKVFTPGPIEEPNLTNNQEFEDFKLLVSYLKRKNVNASFVMQPLNPYSYTNLEVNSPLFKKISSSLSRASFPLLNMYVTSPKEYEPGVLNDIMHLSDLGWVRVNEFIYKTYYDNKK